MGDADPRSRLGELIDSALGIGPGRYTRAEVAERAGVDLEVARRFWRAIGFPEVDPDDRVFVDDDVEVLRGARDLMASGVVNLEGALEIARATGLSATRLSEAQLAALQEAFEGPPIDEDGELDDDAVEQMLDLGRNTLPFLERSLVYMWRRHLAATAKRGLLRGAAGTSLAAVGFADMVSFSEVSAELEEDALEDLVSRFEGLAFDAVGEAGGRVVKLIGDEVLFTAPEAEGAAAAALEIVARCEADEHLPDVRVGLAWGRLVEIGGDVFGPTVNLASRITRFARPATVVADVSLAQALPEGRFETKRIRRPVRFKGAGRAQLVALRRPGEG